MLALKVTYSFKFKLEMAYNKNNNKISSNILIERFRDINDCVNMVCNIRWLFMCYF